MNSKRLLQDFLDLRVNDLIKLLLSPSQMVSYFVKKLGRYEFIKLLTGVERLDTILELEKCLMRNNEFYNAINERLIQYKRIWIGGTSLYSVLYLLVRLIKPRYIVETGALHGHSSAFMLQGLHDNNQGELISIDLPAYSFIKDSIVEDYLPLGCEPGWGVPDYLRYRHRLIMGDSKKLLKQYLQECGEIDMFFHDSLHTFEHMYFEYNCVWPYLSPGGLLISDDIYAWGAKGVFYRFAKDRGKDYRTCGNFGGIKK